MILDLSYIKYFPVTDNIIVDALKLLNINNKKETAEHCLNVAELCAKTAKKHKLDEKAAYTCGILHDISSIIQPADMLKYACENFDYIDEAEKKYNFLLHQRISAVIAKEYFKISDENILSAIECHTTLKAEASDYDMLLFIADKLSWDQNGRPPFYDDVIKAFDVSIYHASFAYIEFILNDASLLYPHKWLMEARNFLFHKCKKEKQ